MANPKELGDRPECGHNEYKGIADAVAQEPTGTVDTYMGPKPAPAAPQFPAPPQLDPTRLAALQKAAEDLAMDEAQKKIDLIARVDCPLTFCPQKANFKETAGPAQSQGQPRVMVVEQTIGFPGSSKIIRVASQVWAQDADAQYTVAFDCKAAG